MRYPEAPSDYLNPKWYDEPHRVRCHCWRNHVDLNIKEDWDDFTDEQKKNLSICFQLIANQEDWSNY